MRTFNLNNSYLFKLYVFTNSAITCILLVMHFTAFVTLNHLLVDQYYVKWSRSYSKALVRMYTWRLNRFGQVVCNGNPCIELSVSLRKI